jgi:endonuclease/exonuclease/phosphatase family metal-dependent hydrolase
MLRILLATILGGCSLSANAQTQRQVVAIGQYNCENLFDTVNDSLKKDDDFTPSGPYHYTEEVYRQKLHNVATVLSTIGTNVTPDGAAIIGLVEVENATVLADLCQQPELKPRNYQYVWFPTPDERGISTAMLYNPKYFKLLGAQPVPVPVETIGWKRPTRSVLHVYGTLAGDTIHVLVNHWPSKSGGEAASAPGRIMAAQVNKRIVDSLQSQGHCPKVMIMGDLNDNPTSEPLEILKCVDKAEKASPCDIFNPWIRPYKKGEGTENYRGEWSLIDQIMLTGQFVNPGNTGWQYYKCEIFNRDFLNHSIGPQKGMPHRSFTIAQVWDNGYSDHYPVLVYLTRTISTK